MSEQRWVNAAKIALRLLEGFIEVLSEGKPVTRQVGRGIETLMEKPDPIEVKEIPTVSRKKRGRKAHA